jgi:hypothetical protein
VHYTLKKVTTGSPASPGSAGLLHGRLWPVLVAALTAVASLASQPSRRPAAPESIVVDAVQVPLAPQDPSATALGDFQYAGGLWLTSRQTDRLHELSDLVITGQDELTAIGDAGILLTARLVFDDDARLVGVTDARLSFLEGEDGAPLTDPVRADAEGMTMLPGGDRLVSFEQAHRILLYPAAGGAPRIVPSPRASFQKNGGMEALTANPDVGPDAYVVGSETSGETWTCRVTAPCVQGQTVDKPEEFGLVAMRWLPDGRMAYLLRAYDPVRRNRITLTILRGATPIARMDMAPPLTVDNFEGMTAVIDAAGGIRFYLVSDDNASSTQRTLLLAFDWRPR